MAPAVTMSGVRHLTDLSAKRHPEPLERSFSYTDVMADTARIRR